MHRPHRQAFDVLSISALDIFASALGVFILMAILMFPYFLRQPALQAEQAAAEAELAANSAARLALRQALADEEADGEAAEAALEAAKIRLARAEAAAAARPGAPDVAAKAGEQTTLLAIADLDLVVVFDSTQSMRRELADLQANLVGVINVLHRLAASLRVGIVAYKDRGDAYLTRAFPLRSMGEPERRAIVDFVQAIEADGGGDRQEPVDEALKVAVDMAWRPEAQGRIIVVGDAEARNQERALDLAGSFRRSAAEGALPRIVSTIVTGDHPAARSFFERLAAAGGGDAAVHQGRMIESVLLSILPDEG